MPNPWDDDPVAGVGASPWENDAPTKKRPDQSYTAGLARAGIGQGTLFGLGDEGMALIRALGDETYSDALKDERAKVESFREENPGTALAAELAGSFVTPGLGLATGALRAGANATRLAKIGQGVKVGAGFGAAYGAASSEGGDGTILDQAYNRGKGALAGGILGAGLGGALPIATGAIGGAARKVADFASPAVARYTNGVDAAADTVMAQRLREAGDVPQAMRDQLAEAQRVGTFYGGGRSASVTETPLALADVSPSMQKLAGSASRSSGEANARAEAFIGTRQTGVTPKNESAVRFADEGGIAHRNPLGPLSKDAAPAGQYERVKDALTRSMTLEDKDFHKFGQNAYRTEQAMMASLKSEADKLYGEARKAAQNFNVQPVIRPVVEKYASAVLDMPIGEATLVKRALRQFTTGNGQLVTSLDGFDKAKRVVDGLIGRARTSGDKNAERVLTGIKNDMIAAVDAAPGYGDKYKAARNYYSSQMEMKDAIDLGRQAFKENSDVVADQFGGLTEGQQKLFRLGLIESFEANIGRKKRTNDVTQIFETPRVQDLLRVVVPRTETATGRVKKGAVYADRPERLADLVGNEKTMVKSNNKILGNSATAERLADDAKFTRQGLGQMITNLRSSGGVTGVILEATATGLNKIFGMREDVAAEVGRRLFTAKPDDIERILQRLEKASPQKAARFYEFLSHASAATGAAVAGQTGQAAANVQPSEMELQGQTPYRRRFDDQGVPLAR
jgi:DNA replication initiation complex subunit (GINS family)